MNLLDLIYLPVALVSAPMWMRKQRSGWGERFGDVRSMLKDPDWSGDTPTILIHAVSVGEINALRDLIPRLTDEARVVVSVTTDTGLARARTLYSESCEVVRYPLDMSWSVRRFLDTIRPDVVGLVELEVWPNFVKGCATRGVSIGIINGRLSARSFKGYTKIRPLLRSTFGRLSFVCAQDRSYAERLKAMGAREVRITGSMKWDSVKTDEGGPSDGALQLARELGLDLTGPIVVGGSTAQDEESLLNSAVPGDVQLVCAPRKPEHFDDAAAALPGCVRRSTGETKPGATRFLLDTIGELSTLYELATIVVIGRSFGDLHGSDPLEPAGLGKPVLIGEAHLDFTFQVETLKEAGAIGVVGRRELGSRIGSLLGDSAERDRMGARARTCVRAHQGASVEHARVLLEAARGRGS